MAKECRFYTNVFVLTGEGDGFQPRFHKSVNSVTSLYKGAVLTVMGELP